MMRALAGVQLALLTALLFTLVGSLAASFAARSVMRSASSLPPAVAARRLRWILAAPLVSGLAMTLLAFMPSIAASLSSASHHCTTHAGHPHLCVVHLPHETSPVGWAALAMAVAYASWRARPLLNDLSRARRLVAALPRCTGRDAWSTIATTEPICAAIGWWRPRVVVSESFRAGVGADALRAAVAHEQAHAARRDALCTFLARLAAIAYPGRVAAPLLAALELATERACDERAAVEVGDRMLVADAILRSQRLGLARLTQLHGAIATFGPDHWTKRVEALLDPLAQAPTGLRRWDLLAGLAAVALLPLAGELHHAAETALSLIAH